MKVSPCSAPYCYYRYGDDQTPGKSRAAAEISGSSGRTDGRRGLDNELLPIFLLNAPEFHSHLWVRPNMSNGRLGGDPGYSSSQISVFPGLVKKPRSRCMPSMSCCLSAVQSAM